MTKTNTVIVSILGGLMAIILLGILARYTFLKPQFDEWGAGLQRINNWEQQYRAQNPNATDAEVDAAFRKGIADMERWKEEYKRNNPGATDQQAEDALKNGLETLGNSNL